MELAGVDELSHLGAVVSPADEADVARLPGAADALQPFQGAIAIQIVADAQDVVGASLQVRALRHRRYDPGLLTALGTLAPTAIVGLRALRADRRASRPALAAGAVAGVASSIALPILLKRR